MLDVNFLISLSDYNINLKVWKVDTEQVDPVPQLMEDGLGKEVLFSMASTNYRTQPPGIIFTESVLSSIFLMTIKILFNKRSRQLRLK